MTSVRSRLLNSSLRADGRDQVVAGREVAWTFEEDVVLDRRTGSQIVGPPGLALRVARELDLAMLAVAGAPGETSVAVAAVKPATATAIATSISRTPSPGMSRIVRRDPVGSRSPGAGLDEIEPYQAGDTTTPGLSGRSASDCIPDRRAMSAAPYGSPTTRSRNWAMTSSCSGA